MNAATTTLAEAIAMTPAEWDAFMARRRDAAATAGARAVQADRIALALGKVA